MHKKTTLEMIAAQMIADYQKETMSTDTAARYLGISRRQLWALATARIIAHSKPNGKMLYFKKADLDAFMENNHIASMQEINDRANTMKGGAK